MLSKAKSAIIGLFSPVPSGVFFHLGHQNDKSDNAPVGSSGRGRTEFQFRFLKKLRRDITPLRFLRRRLPDKVRGIGCGVHAFHESASILSGRWLSSGHYPRW